MKEGGTIKNLNYFLGSREKQKGSDFRFMMEWFIDTFSPMASLIRTVSPDILPTTSPVLVSLSKKLTSCLKIVLRYKPLILALCLSPVIIQQVTSGT